LLFCLKEVHYRALYRWLKGDFACLFPRLPSLSRLLWVLEKYEVLTDRMLKELTFLAPGQIRNLPRKANKRVLHCT
jgi:hypothetical protein